MSDSSRRRFILELGGATALAALQGCTRNQQETGAGAAAYPNWSGIYPHLAFFSAGDECGTGAVVPWAGKLWAVTYSPHKPFGSDDKLYEIDSDLNVIIRPESIGGTPANRLIHRESQQLFIGPYAIDRQGRVRVIPYEVMPGRPTGNARHLTAPAEKIYYATMEEGFYEVDVRTLEVTQLYEDGNSLFRRKAEPDISGSLLPGYHGKGLYSGQGRLIYANNGENSALARTRPDIPSGCLAEWDGKDWKVVRRNQFNEVSGPGGIHGNEITDDPVWSTGWDHRSALLMLLDGGKWQVFRLPKATHTYDGAHGWNTEWPRIRDIGEDDLLMTMHGMFWRFPKTFSAANTAGISPRSTYLKVVGDFCRWNGRVVMGCDDAAKTEFYNKREIKTPSAAPGQSQSNLWFVQPEQLDQLGHPLGRGALWLKDPVKADEFTDPYLFAGFERRIAHLLHDSAEPVTFSFEVDKDGTGIWQALRSVDVPASGYTWVEFLKEESGQWIRMKASRDCNSVSACFHYSSTNQSSAEASSILDGLATPDSRSVAAGLIRPRGEFRRSLQMAATQATVDGGVEEIGYYELGRDMKLRRIEDPAAHKELKEEAFVKEDTFSVDDASVIVTDDEGHRFRLPKGDPAFDVPGNMGWPRLSREVVTERDIFNCHGSIYELPSNNAGGLAAIRPVATLNRRIMDYCSWRGMMVLAGVDLEQGQSNRHIIRSEDGRSALWVGVIDDLWKFGKAVGRGGPWKTTPVKAGVPSDQYLMTGYDRKSLTLFHQASEPVTIYIEVDISGTGQWGRYESLAVAPGETVEHQFPEAFQAYWVRFVASRDAVATAQLTYS